MKDKNLPVVILTDETTASSAEAIVIAFKGRNKTRFLGLPTRGIPTSNFPFKLSDGAVLNLTTIVDADRTGKIYDSRIMPDAEVKTNWSSYGTEDDAVLRVALEWIKN